VKENDVMQLVWFSTAIIGVVCMSIGVGYLLGAGWGWLLVSVAFLVFSAAFGREILNERRNSE
jgi:hypothetical protein